MSIRILWKYHKNVKNDAGGLQSEKMVSKSAPNGTKREQEDSQGQPKGNQREPKGSQRATKIHLKVDLRKRARKVLILGGSGYSAPGHFGRHFPSKIDEKNDAKIDA